MTFTRFNASSRYTERGSGVPFIRIVWVSGLEVQSCQSAADLLHAIESTDLGPEEPVLLDFRGQTWRSLMTWQIPQLAAASVRRFRRCVVLVDDHVVLIRWMLATRLSDPLLVLNTRDAPGWRAEAEQWLSGEQVVSDPFLMM